MSCFLSLSHIKFEYESSVKPLFSDLNIQFSHGWTGIIGANGSGKTTLLKLLTGEVCPNSGIIRHSGLRSLCEQEIIQAPSNLNQLFDSYDSHAFELQNNLNLAFDMKDRWSTLSMGERKKLQIAAALFKQPDILCIDEPTNHLDTHGRRQLALELSNFNGIGILVSHDRKLLDSLCSQCLFLEDNSQILRSGNYSACRELIILEHENNLKQCELLKRDINRNKKELQRRRQKEQQAKNRDSKRKIAKKDHDAKSKIDAARLTSRSRKSSDSAGKQAKKLNLLKSELNTFEKLKTINYKLQITYGCYSHKNALLEFPARKISLGPERHLSIPELVIGNKDRISLSGKNGTGKSTLIMQIVKELKLNHDEYIFLPQELNKSMTDRIYSTVQHLSHDDFSKVMNVVASLGSRPEQVMNTRSCSPGEWRKLFLGLGVLLPTCLIIMDEPTNHLDLPSIDCLENALGECHCALLLISHDLVFIHKLCSSHWFIKNTSKDENTLFKNFRTGGANT